MLEAIDIGYKIAGMLICFSILVGIWQIFLLKKDIIVRNKRASAEKAVEASSRYLTKYVEIAKVCTIQQLAEKLETFKGTIGDFTEKSIPKKDVTLKRMGLPNALEKLNELEIIASFFTTGVADQAIGCEIIGRSFCATVEYDYDLISIFRNGKKHDPWANIVKLYNTWRPHLNNSEVNESIESLKSRIRLLEREQDQKKIDAVKPIGL